MLVVSSLKPFLRTTLFLCPTPVIHCLIKQAADSESEWSRSKCPYLARTFASKLRTMLLEYKQTDRGVMEWIVRLTSTLVLSVAHPYGYKDLHILRTLGILLR